MRTESVLEEVPDSSSLEKTEELVRLRAYGYYELRGREDGHDVEDWLRAEAEILGKKPTERVPKPHAAKSVAA